MSASHIEVGDPAYTESSYDRAGDVTAIATAAARLPTRSTARDVARRALRFIYAFREPAGPFLVDHGDVDRYFLDPQNLRDRESMPPVDEY